MKWRMLKSREEIEKLYLEHMKNNRSKYDPGLVRFMERDFMNSIGQHRVFSEFTQMFDEFEAIDPRDNMYFYHLQKLKENFDIGCNILEIGGGAIPSFAKKIAREQIKMGTGTITVYDPRLIVSNYPEFNNMTLYRTEFDSTIDISKYDLITGIMPCMGTDEFLDAVRACKKDFYMALCGCDHFADRFGYYQFGFYRPSYNDYLNIANDICEECDLGELVIDYLPDEFEISYPIIYNKRK